MICFFLDFPAAASTSVGVVATGWKYPRVQCHTVPNIYTRRGREKPIDRSTTKGQCSQRDARASIERSVLGNRPATLHSQGGTCERCVIARAYHRRPLYIRHILWCSFSPTRPLYTTAFCRPSLPLILSRKLWWKRIGNFQPIRYFNYDVKTMKQSLRRKFCTLPSSCWN